MTIRGNCVISGNESSSYFHAYVDVLHRRMRWVIAGTLIGLAGSLAYAFTAPHQFSASAQLLVEPSAVVGAFGSTAQPVSQTDVETELQLVTSTQVRQKVAVALGSPAAIAAAEIGQTNVIALTATSRSPAGAARIANAYADQFVAYQESVGSRNLRATESQLRAQIQGVTSQIRSLRGSKRDSAEEAALLNQQAVLREQLAQVRVSGAVNLAGVGIVSRAVAPVAPSSPKPVSDVLIGLVAGLAVGVAGAFTRDNLDDTVSTAQSVERTSGATALASVPLIPAWRNRTEPMVVTAVEPTAPASEAYRALRTSIQFIRQERPLRSVLVASPSAGDGKTSTVANLGVTFAQVGERVVVVSCDLRRPRLSSFFGIEEQSGLTSVLLGNSTLEQVLTPVRAVPGLWVLPSGPVPPNPAELLSLETASELFAALRAEFDLVLIDSPPVLPVTDAVVLTRHADATLITVASGRTRQSDLRRTAERFAQVGAFIAGVVINQTTRQPGYRRYGYGRYGYERYGYAPQDGVPESGNVQVRLTDLRRAGAGRTANGNSVADRPRSYAAEDRTDR